MRNVGWMDRRVLQRNVWCSLMSYSVAEKQNCRCAISLTLEIQPVAEDANADRRENYLPTSSFFTNAIWTCDNGHHCTIRIVIALHFRICIDPKLINGRANKSLKHCNHLHWTEDFVIVRVIHDSWIHYFLEFLTKWTTWFEIWTCFKSKTFLLIHLWSVFYSLNIFILSLDTQLKYFVISHACYYLWNKVDHSSNFHPDYEAPHTEHTSPDSWQHSDCACVKQEMMLLKLVTMQILN